MNTQVAQRQASEDVVVSAPLSFHGSASRIWKITHNFEGGAKVAMQALAVTLILLAWVVVICWYGIFGILVIPYRLIRRGSRKRKRESMQHREMLAAIQGQTATHPDSVPGTLQAEAQHVPPALPQPQGQKAPDTPPTGVLSPPAPPTQP